MSGDPANCEINKIFIGFDMALHLVLMDKIVLNESEEKLKVLYA